nr:hypothetical protein [uncultured Carboxylicivirga sp.]
MPSKSRIPVSINEFNTYLIATDSYLTEGTPETNATRLGILAQEQEIWHSFLTEWNNFFSSYSNKRSERTMLVTEELHSVIKKTKLFDQTSHLLDRIASSPNVTLTDLTVFNIKSGDLAKSSRSKPVTPIDTQVVPMIQQIGGGSLSIKSKNNHDERTAILKEANCVQYRYIISDTPPESVHDEALKQGLSTRATFVLETGANNAGKRIYLYFRWYHTSYQALAGPWSRVYSVLIV